MKKINSLIFIMLLYFTVPVSAEEVPCKFFSVYNAQYSFATAAELNITLTWDAPTTNIDGTPLTDLAGYKIYVGRITGIYDAGVIDVGNVLTITLTNFCEGIYYFVATAYDTSGNESGYSNEVNKAINISPATPTNMR